MSDTGLCTPYRVLATCWYVLETCSLANISVPYGALMVLCHGHIKYSTPRHYYTVLQCSAICMPSTVYLGTIIQYYSAVLSACPCSVHLRLICILHRVCLAHVELEELVQYAMDTEDGLEGSVRPAEEGGTELEAEAEEGELEGGDTELEEGKLAEEGELAGAAELEAEEGELEGPVQNAMDTEDEFEGSVQRSQRLARLRKRRQREWPPTPLPPPTRPPPPTHPPPARPPRPQPPAPCRPPLLAPPTRPPPAPCLRTCAALPPPARPPRPPAPYCPPP